MSKVHGCTFPLYRRWKQNAPNIAQTELHLCFVFSFMINVYYYFYNIANCSIGLCAIFLCFFDLLIMFDVFSLLTHSYQNNPRYRIEIKPINLNVLLAKGQMFRLVVWVHYILRLKSGNGENQPWLYFVLKRGAGDLPVPWESGRN